MDKKASDLLVSLFIDLGVASNFIQPLFEAEQEIVPQIFRQDS